ncbi:hypothetical protein VTL71DRAFT_11451 [Oculimacula yallundae]|uniref:Uncharacterized protein n=1 Tax=Oculimacula yallundae TaxID=86028 RepID=A0ABR4CQ27_9HELO
MGYLLPIFQAVSLTFACLAIYTGAQAILSPIGFSKSFGLVITPTSKSTSYKRPAASSSPPTHHDLTESYIALMGIRQLSTGLILLVFAYQGKWTEMATILSIIGIVVAGTDGVYLCRAGFVGLGVFHALPGACISALACSFLISGSGV